MLAFRDFAPQELESPAWGKHGKWTPLEDVVAAANDWIRTDQIDVISVETVVRPNHGRRSNPEQRAANSPAVVINQYLGWEVWVQCVRVWYQAST